MTKETIVWVGKSNRPIEVVNRKVIHCETFNEFVGYYINIPSADRLPDIISLSMTDVFDNGTLSPIEYIDCYSNFIKLTNNRFNQRSLPADIRIRVGAKLVTRSQVEMLQKTNISGIGPMQVVYGKDAVDQSLNDLQKYGATWPSYLISDSHTAQQDVMVLTPRQQTIFDLIRNRGLSNKQIGQYLNLSESAVKFHIGHILKKYGLRNRTQLAIAFKSV